MTLDAAITAPVRSERRLIEHVQSILSGKSRKFDKVPSIINVVDNIIPGFSLCLSNLLYRSNYLPFNSAPIELINYGAAYTVFLLEMEDENKVLKINRKSLGKRLGGLLKIAKGSRGRRETVSSWYNGEFELLPRAEYVILNGPILGSPATAMLQSYIYGEKKDFFKDFSDDDLIRLMEENDDLRNQFVFFAERTISIYFEYGLCIDFLGKNNIMLVNNKDGLRLIIADHGFVDLAASKRLRPEIFSQLEEHICRMKFILQRLSSYASCSNHVSINME
jgi:hypothetical protein